MSEATPTAAPATPAQPAQPATPEQRNIDNVPARSVASTLAKGIDQPKEDAKPAAPPVEKYEIKLNGKTKQVSKEELIRLAQLSEAATEKFETAAQKEKRISQIIKNATNSPIEALLDPALGLNKEQIKTAMEEWYYREYIEPTTLSEDQRRIKALERENAQFKQMQEEVRRQEQQAAMQKAEAEYLQHFQKQIITAMDASKLAKTPSNVKRVAFYMRKSMENGWEAPLDLIIEKVKQDRAQEDAEIKDHSYDEIVDRYGEEFVNKLIAENLKRIRDRRAASGGAPFQKKPLQPSSDERVSMVEVNRRLRAMRGK